MKLRIICSKVQYKYCIECVCDGDDKYDNSHFVLNCLRDNSSRWTAGQQQLGRHGWVVAAAGDFTRGYGAQMISTRDWGH